VQRHCVQHDRTRARPPPHCTDMHVAAISRQASCYLPEPSLPATLVERVDGVDDEGHALRATTCAWPTSRDAYCETPLNLIISVRPRRFTVIKYSVERRVGRTLTSLVAPLFFVRSMRPSAIVELPCELANVTTYE